MLAAHQNPCSPLLSGTTTRQHFPVSLAVWCAMWLSYGQWNMSHFQAWATYTTHTCLLMLFSLLQSGERWPWWPWKPVLKIAEPLSAWVPEWLCGESHSSLSPFSSIRCSDWFICSFGLGWASESVLFKLPDDCDASHVWPSIRKPQIQTKTGLRKKGLSMVSSTYSTKENCQ